MTDINIKDPGGRLAELQDALRDVIFDGDVVTVATGTVDAADSWHGKMVRFTVECTVTIPPGLRDDLSFGWSQDGADPVTFEAGGGVTLQALDDALMSAGQFAVGGVSAWSEDVFRLYGPLI